ncbi:MAG: response regulator [Desulfobacteraceae bacterium]|nr:response regulator [Desulfobacteraceae bacterium]
MKAEDYSQCRVLIVDDEAINVDILVSALQQDYNLSIALNGQSALFHAKSHPLDLILLDVAMPGMDGYEVCSRLKSDVATSSIPVVFVSAMGSLGDKTKGLGLGAVDFITKPYQLVELKARIRTHLRMQQAMKSLVKRNRSLDRCVREHTRELRETQVEIIYRLSRAVEYRDTETAMHVKRLSHFCRVLAFSLGCDEETCELLHLASPMHDIGKIGIPDRILLKNGPLDDEERTIMQSHTIKGAEILSGHDSALITAARVIALTHHERWDGSGYPRGLSRDEIPLYGRIVSVCDVFDALTSLRPYKKGWPVDEAVDEIRACSGSHFDPQIVEAFDKALPEVVEIMDNLHDEPHQGNSFPNPGFAVSA